MSNPVKEQLIELTTNEELQIKFSNGYQEFPNCTGSYGRLVKEFPSCLCEGGFSSIATLLTKIRNRVQLLNAATRGSF